MVVHLRKVDGELSTHIAGGELTAGGLRTVPIMENCLEKLLRKDVAMRT